MTTTEVNHNAAQQALNKWEIAREEEIVKTLVNDPELFARVRKMPGPLSRRTDLVARADAELALIAISEILK